MAEEKEKTEGNKPNLASEPPSEEKLLSDEVFKDNLDFESDIDNLPV